MSRTAAAIGAAVETIEPELLAMLPEFQARLEWVLANRTDLASLVSHWQVPGAGERRLLALARGHRMKRVLRRMLDPGRPPRAGDGLLVSVGSGYRLQADAAVLDRVSAITPVPGGVGPVTTATLLANVVNLAALYQGKTQDVS